MSNARYTNPILGPAGWQVHLRKLKLGAGQHGYIQKILLWMILMEPLSPKPEIEHEVLDYHSLGNKHILPRVSETLNFSKVHVLSSHFSHFLTVFFKEVFIILFFSWYNCIRNRVFWMTWFTIFSRLPPRCPDSRHTLQLFKWLEFKLSWSTYVTWRTPFLLFEFNASWVDTWLTRHSLFFWLLLQF